MNMPKYNDRDMTYVGKIGLLYMFVDKKTGVRETFTKEQLAEFDKDVRNKIIQHNMSISTAYRYKKMKNDKEDERKTNGELIFEWLLEHPNKTANDIANSLFYNNYHKIPSYIRIFNKSSIVTGKQICSIKKKIFRNNQGYWRNVYYVEIIK